LIFTEADVVLVNKIDLAPLLDFDIDSFTKAVKELNAGAEILQVSCKIGQGLKDWFSWLESQIKSRHSQ